MSAIGDALDEVIRGDLAGRLKQAGYRKSARTFYAEYPDHTCVVNVQGSKWNQGAEGQFAVNLGVYYPRPCRSKDLIRKNMTAQLENGWVP